MPGKLIRDLSDAELQAEFAVWDSKVKSATSWGAALAAAHEFREECSREMRRRKNPHIPLDAATARD